MSEILSMVLAYCRNDYLKAEKEMDKLRNKALELETGSDSEDEDFTPSGDESSDDYQDDDVVEEIITVVRLKGGHYKIN